MKTLGIIATFAATMGLGFVAVPRSTPAPVPQKATPQAVTIQQTSGYSAGPAIPLTPTIPEFLSFGQIHVNGQVALEQGPATGAVTVGAFQLCRHRIWKTQGPGIPIEVHRVLAEDGSAVYWWAVLLDALWQPKNLGGTDYHCSGGGFNVTP